MQQVDSIFKCKCQYEKYSAGQLYKAKEIKLW